MKYVLKTIGVDNLSFSLSKTKPNPDTPINQQIGRLPLRRINENLYCVTLFAKIEGTEENVQPFNVNAELSGIFEVTEVKNETEMKKFVTEASKVLYPHLCATYTNLCVTAHIPPLQLPVKNGPLFPEDEEKFAFVVGGNDDGRPN